MSSNYFTTLFSLLVLVSGFVMAQPNEAVWQTQRSIERQRALLKDFLGTWKLTCKRANVVKLVAETKNGKVEVRTVYGDASPENITQRENDTTILQLQVGALITLLVSGPDSDEGTALIVLPGAFDDTIGAREAGFPVLDRYAEATVIEYGDSWGSSMSRYGLNCELK